MNYAVVAVGGLVLLVICGWFAWGRGVFGGSITTLDVVEELSEKE